MKIYADNAATTKMSRAAIEAMLPCLEEEYGNPSSLYTLGQRAREILEEARAEIAAVLHAEPGEITFTPAAARPIIRRSAPRRPGAKSRARPISSPPPLSTTPSSTP